MIGLGKWKDWGNEQAVGHGEIWEHSGKIGEIAKERLWLMGRFRDGQKGKFNIRMLGAIGDPRQ